VLDGEAGTVYGGSSAHRKALSGLPSHGLASNAKLVRPVKKDALVTCADVELDQRLFSYKLRRTMEKEFRVS
jgi:predicted homoserine dehydrogenase-like protein